jgi:hypothetical protein
MPKPASAAAEDAADKPPSLPGAEAPCLIEYMILGPGQIFADVLSYTQLRV